jgi:hypothetical protein
MDHAIADLISRMEATIDLWDGFLSKKELEPEIRAYVKAINALEEYYYGQKRTTLEMILY